MCYQPSTANLLEIHLQLPHRLQASLKTCVAMSCTGICELPASFSAAFSVSEVHETEFSRVPRESLKQGAAGYSSSRHTELTECQN